MLAQWTGDAVAKMHIYGISQNDLANKLGCTREYVNIVLNGRKTPKGAQGRFSEALDELIAQKQYSKVDVL